MNHKSRLRGFTLIELIVVLVIVSLTVALVAPRVSSNWKQMEEGDFLQQFTQTITRSRLFAMNCGRPVAFRLNGTTRVYGFEGSPRLPIPINAEVYSENLERDPATGDFLVIFLPDGSLIGNDLKVVFDREHIYYVSIHPLFGTVSVKRTK
jgi:general secretion pathway protein H